MKNSIAFLMGIFFYSQCVPTAIGNEAAESPLTASQNFITVYHAQCIDGIFLSSLVEALDPNKEKLHYLRSAEYTLDESVTAASFLEMPEFINAKGMNDINAWKRQRMICVSFNLMDTTEMDSASSFLKRPTGILGSKISDGMPGAEKFNTILSNICYYYLQATHSTASITRISKDLEEYYEQLLSFTNRASFHRLYTFKIDKNIFEKTAFLAKPYGHDPVSGEIVGLYEKSIDHKWPFDYSDLSLVSHDKFTLLSNFIPKFIDNPQARLLITHPLLCKAENVKISIQDFAASNVRIKGISAQSYVSHLPHEIKQLINQ
ncbi:MAG: hypothetical protein K0M45_08365 [Candidatus Paracaedibacteraceae bacterium]|nr:hypothetical protein [Candidatus Paracaedibacteraceae bacterium]